MEKRILLLFFLISGTNLIAMKFNKECTALIKQYDLFNKSFSALPDQSTINKNINDLCLSMFKSLSVDTPVNPLAATVSESKNYEHLYNQLDKIIKLFIDYYPNNTEWRDEAANLASELASTGREYHYELAPTGHKYHIVFNLLKGYGNNILNRLISAICRQSTRDIKELITPTNKHLISQRDDLGYRPLYYALLTNNLEIVQLLGNYDVDVSIPVGPNNKTALDITARDIACSTTLDIEHSTARDIVHQKKTQKEIIEAIKKMSTRR